MVGPERNGHFYNTKFRKYGVKFRIYGLSEGGNLQNLAEITAGKPRSGPNRVGDLIFVSGGISPDSLNSLRVGGDAVESLASKTANSIPAFPLIWCKFTINAEMGVFLLRFFRLYGLF